MKCNEKGCNPIYEKKGELHIFKCKKCKMTHSDTSDKRLQVKWNKSIQNKNEQQKVKVTRTKRSWWQ